MESKELFSEIRTFCADNADEKLVEKYSRYFKEGFDSYGVNGELLQSKAKEIAERKGFDLNSALEVSRLLIPSGKYEEASFAYLLTNHFKKQFDFATFKAIEEWFQLGIANWGHTDVISSELVSYFIENRIVDLKNFESWKESRYKFQRRAVPVSFIKPFKKGLSVDVLLDFIDSMMMDNERVVHQGLGWFIRECWKKDPEKVELFLHKWKNDAARLIFQYATEKMTKEYRVQFRKEKKKVTKH